jgi:alpha-2-macroglobulin
MRGLLQRQRRGVWDLTVANAWGVLAVERFSQLFEATSATGTTKAQVAEVIQEVVWTAQPHGKTLTFPWPGQQQQLIVDHVGTGRPWVTL